MNDSERALLSLAVEKGFITEQDIVTAGEQAADASFSPLQFLIAVNLLSDDIVEDLQNDLQGRSTASRRMTPEEPAAYQDDEDQRQTIDAVRRPYDDGGEPVTGDYTPGETGRTRHFEVSAGIGDQIRFVSVEKEFPKNWDRYTYVRFLGEGGMGRVYQAFDPRLRRNVAIKFVRVGDHESEQRFLNEAQAQARVTHVNLCEIYEVGEVDGRPYIVMQFVDGVVLNRIGDELGLEQKLMIIRDVAEGLHHAHRTGLIHRDIKPSNIMVEQSMGGYKPVVLDFGLARQQAAPGMTVTGSVIGTPHYMPPEQARGEIHKLDRRGDVYSLGATMYELLVGQPPFSGTSSVNVLFKVINDEPEGLRGKNKHIPEDVETITLKCMEKDPTERYDSARALAQDISYYLDGEPILGRRQGVLYRLRKKAAKNKLAVAIAAGAFVVLASVLFWSWRRQVAATRQARLALQFGQEVQEMEDDLRKVFLVPLHNVRGRLNALESRMDGFRVRMAEVGPIGLGPGHYALGRAYLALERYEEARENLELSWRYDFRESQVAYALGRVMGALYQRELSRVQNLHDPIEREKAKIAIELNFRKPALEYLEKVPSDQMESPEYVQALLAFYEGEYARALQHARAAYAHNVWFYEALQLQGEIFKARGDEARNHGSNEAAMTDYRAAEEMFVQAATVGESDPQLQVALAGLALSVIQMNLYTSERELQDQYDKGLAACDRALQADSAYAEAYLAASSLHLRMAEDLKTSDQAQEHVAAAIENAEKARDLGSTDAEFFSQLGRAYFLRGSYLNSQGQDPSETFEKGHEAYVAAIAGNPSYRNYNRMGSLLSEMALYQRTRGLDVEATWHEAVDAFTLARKSDPSKMGAPYNLGVLMFQQAHYLLSRGRDPLDQIERAAEALNHARSINPKLPRIYTALGDTYTLQAEHRLYLRKDPTDAAARAINAFQNAIALNSDFARAYQGLGETHLLLYRAAFEHGLAGEEHLQESLANLNRAVALEPDYFLPSQALADAYRQIAALRILGGTPDLEALRRAVGTYKDALTRNPSNVNILTGLAGAHALAAEIQLLEGRDPSVHIEETRALVDQVDGLTEGDYRPHLSWAQALLVRARGQIRHHEDPSPTLSEARKALEAAASRASRNDIYLTSCYERLLFNLYQQQRGTEGTWDTNPTAPLDQMQAGAQDFPRALCLKAAHLYLLAAGAEDGSAPALQKQASLAEEAALKGNRNLKNHLEQLKALVAQKAR